MEFVFKQSSINLDLTRDRLRSFNFVRSISFVRLRSLRAAIPAFFAFDFFMVDYNQT